MSRRLPQMPGHLHDKPDSDATRNFIAGMATAKANQEIQEWLGKYGTARVKLNVDEISR